MKRMPWAPGEDLDDDETATERPSPTLVSLHFIRIALRRRLWVCIVGGILGLLAASGFMLASPSHSAKAALVLTHSSDVLADDAVKTDVSLLQSRTVAARTVAQLDLAMTPEDFFDSVTYESASAEVMTLTLTAPTDAEAVRRLEAFASIYLTFRAEQLSLQTKILVEGMQGRINKLHTDVQSLSERIERLSAEDGADGSRLTDTISQRAYAQGRIESLQQSMEDISLENSAVVEASRILDPPAIEPGFAKRTIALGLASGLIGGGGLGAGLVLFLAIISDRLRRRADVAEALGASVPLSVGRIAAFPRALRWLPPIRALDRRRAEERVQVADLIATELQRNSRRVALACIDNADEVAFAVATTADSLSANDCSVSVIDLMDRPTRGLRLSPASGTPGSSAVLRARGVPALARDASDLLPTDEWDNGDDTPVPELADTTLVVADIDPAVGADHLKAWADRAIVFVTAGRSSAEKTRTIADLIRAAGLDLRFAVLLRTERTDNSSGVLTSSQPAALQLPDRHSGASGLTGASQVR